MFARYSAHLEASHPLHNMRQNKQLFLRPLIIIPLPLQPDPDPVWWASDTSRPDGLVQGGGDTNVLDLHGFLGEFDDGFDGAGGSCWCETQRVEC